MPFAENVDRIVELGRLDRRQEARLQEVVNQPFARGGAVFEAASRKPHVARLAHRGLYQGTNRPKWPDRIAKQIVVATTIPISVVAHIERTNPRTAPAAAHMITLGLRSNSGMATPVYFSRSFPAAPGSLFFDGSVRHVELLELSLRRAKLSRAADPRVQRVALAAGARLSAAKALHRLNYRRERKWRGKARRPPGRAFNDAASAAEIMPDVSKPLAKKRGAQARIRRRGEETFARRGRAGIDNCCLSASSVRAPWREVGRSR